jgi:hypothetical protein
VLIKLAGTSHEPNHTAANNALRPGNENRGELRSCNKLEANGAVLIPGAFDPIRVGVGRMGIIYSIILEVVPAYDLIEVNLEHFW